MTIRVVWKYHLYRLIIFQRRNGSWEDTCPDERKIDMWGTYVDQDENCREYSVDKKHKILIAKWL